VTTCYLLLGNACQSITQTWWTIASFAPPDRRSPAMKKRMESMWSRQHHLFSYPFFCIESGDECARRQSLFPALGHDGGWTLSARWYMRRHPGLSGLVGDLSGGRRLEWTLRVLMGDRRVCDATHGRRHHADFSQMADHRLSVWSSWVDRIGALTDGAPAGFGASKVAPRPDCAAKRED